MTRKRFIPLRKKLEAVQQLKDGVRMADIKRQFKCQGNQVHYWAAQEEELLAKRAANAHAVTVHSGGKAEHPELEAEVYDWVMSERGDGLPVLTDDIIMKAQEIDPNFKGGKETTMIAWARCFRKRYDLTFRCATRVAQSMPAESSSV